jgi:hypothetical protein
MTHTEWRALAGRLLDLDEMQLHAVVLQFLDVTDAATATAAIDRGLALVEQVTARRTHLLPTS